MYLVPIEEKEDFRNNTAAYSKTHLPESFREKPGEYFCPMFCEGDKTYPSDVDCPVCQMHLEQITEVLLSSGLKKTAPEIQPGNSSGNAGKFYCPMFCEGDRVYDSNVGCPVCGMDLVQIPGGAQEDLTAATLKKKFLVAAIFTVPVFILSMGGMLVKFPISDSFTGWLEFLLSLPVVFYAGWFLIGRGIKSFKTGNLNMFSLIALGVISAFVFSLITLLFPGALNFRGAHSASYFEAVCVILTLVILGQLLEAQAHKRTGNAIRELVTLTPDEANLVENGIEKRVRITVVNHGDLLRIRPGDKIPVDGEVTEGNSSVDESMITGEAVPAEKFPGEKLIAGTVNGNGVLLMKATQIGEDTLLSNIIRLVNEAAREKPPVQRLADKVSKIFVPAVLAIAALTFLLWFVFGGENRLPLAFANALSVLIVACPCALGLATPMSLMAGIGNGARNGILIRKTDALERLEKINVLLTDKTGTLTKGKPTLETVVAEGLAEKDLLQTAAALSRNSDHPLAKPILKGFDGGNLLAVTGFENISGKGITGLMDAKRFYLGNTALLHDFNIKINPDLAAKARKYQLKGKTTSFLAGEGKALGLLVFSDEVKTEAKAAIQQLQKDNIHVGMLTGDSVQAAKAVADQLDIQHFHASLLPMDKHRIIEKYQQEGKIVAMCGDGINDAPALAKADVGIAMGTGAGAAIESADLTLLNGDISAVAKARILSRKMMKNIRQNLFLAFVYNILGIPLAAGVLYPAFGISLNPMIAAGMMSLSSLSVILNSMRLNNGDIKPKN